MNTSALTLSVILMGASLSSGANRQSLADHPLLPAQAREDITILRQALEQGHPDLYRFTSKRQLQRLWARIDHQARTPMTAVQLYRLLAPVVADIKDGHTKLEPSLAETDQERTQVPLLPLYVRVEQMKAYAFRDYSLTHQYLVGAEILSINHAPMRHILATMASATSHDGNVVSAVNFRLSGRPFPLLLHLLLGIESPFLLTYRKPGGDGTETAKMNGLLWPEWDKISKRIHPEDFPRPFPEAELRFTDDDRVALMRIRIWSGSISPEKTPLPIFLRHSFTQMRDRGTRALIIDIRGNPGGEDEPGRQLFSHLTDHPFLYYRDLVLNGTQFNFFRFAEEAPEIPPQNMEKRSDGNLHYTGHPNWGIQKPTAPYFSGAVFVLQNGGSFSSSAEFASIMRAKHRAVFIGEENGGAYDGNTSGWMPYIVLPNSHLRLRLALMGYYMAVNRENPRDRGVLPDYPVRLTVDDQLAGSDPQMEKALELARSTSRIQ